MASLLHPTADSHLAHKDTLFDLYISEGGLKPESRADLTSPYHEPRAHKHMHT